MMRGEWEGGDGDEDTRVMKGEWDGGGGGGQYNRVRHQYMRVSSVPPDCTLTPPPSPNLRIPHE